VKSLPHNVTVQTVEEEFKKFGAIKPGGIQVRNNKIDRFCFGFIEFESQQSMQAAIEVGLFPDCSSIFRTVVRIAKLLSLNCVLTLV
jgi:hypothetical protein